MNTADNDGLQTQSTWNVSKSKRRDTMPSIQNTKSANVLAIENIVRQIAKKYARIEDSVMLKVKPGTNNIQNGITFIVCATEIA